MQSVTCDGLYIISGLATCMGAGFSALLEDSWTYITHALKNIDDHELFKSAIGCIADISRACNE